MSQSTESVPPAAVEVLFDYSADQRSPLLSRAWLAVLYVAGAIAWAYFLGWARVPLNFADWADINVPRLMFLGNAIAAGEWPLHMVDTHSLHDVTDRFLSLPDVITTPQTLLLPWLGVERFVVFDVLIQYTIGAAGLLALRRRFRWSLFVFTGVYLLFLFNGNILAHVGVGHFTWTPYFVFPWFVLFAVQLVDGERGWRWVTRVAFAMFYMVLAGGQHHFTWGLMFLGFLIPVCLDGAGWIIAAGAASVLLGAVRLLPPALNLADFARAGWSTDIIGFPSVLHMIRGMVELRRESLPIDPRLPGNFTFFDPNYFEFNYYVGAIGAAAILYYGLYRWLRSEEGIQRPLILPTLALSLLSLGTVFRLVRATAIPLVQSERIVSRILSLPMSVMIVMAGVLLQQAIDRGRWSAWNRIVALMILAFVAVDVSAGVRLFRVAQSSGSMPHVEVAADAGAIAHRDDPAYTRMLGAGAAVTLTVAAGLIGLSLRERRTIANP